MNPEALWRKHIGTTITKRDVWAINALELDEHQVGWLLSSYKIKTPYPNPKDFISFASAMDEYDIPDSLSCAAYLSKNEKLMELADELETLRGAWDVDRETENRMQSIRKELEAILV